MKVTFKLMNNNCYSVFDEELNILGKNFISKSEVYSFCRYNSYELKKL